MRLNLESPAAEYNAQMRWLHALRRDKKWSSATTSEWLIVLDSVVVTMRRKLAKKEARERGAGRPRGWHRRLSDADWRNRDLQADLKLLRKVIRGMQSVFRRKEQKRRSALAAWHKKSAVVNERRRLFAAAMAVLRDNRRRRQMQDDPARLLDAANRVIARHHRRHNKAVRAKLVKILRRRLENVVKRLKIPIAGLSESARKLTGATLEELREHLEKQFKPGMCWANHGYTGWHVDHIKPLAAFDLRDESQQREAFHYTNLQPLWAAENLEKRDKF